jgi:hypothetical protein
VSKSTFNLWPVPEDGLPYGPQPKQRLLFIEELPEEDTFVQGINIKRPHKHPMDVVLYIGAARSGKTLSATARVIKYMLNYPGSTAIIGAENYRLLGRSALNEWKNRFTEQTEWDHLKKKNRLIMRRPTQNDQRVVFNNGKTNSPPSQAYFLYFSNPEILKGIDADIIHFEEADLLPDEGAFEELLARLSGRKGPLRQLILTTNPVKANKGWIRDKFKLWQLKEDFKGTPEPIVPPCECHLCQYCLNAGKGKWEFVKNGKSCTERGSKCPNPECYFISKIGKPAEKDNDCPGNQVFYRVIQTESDDNIHKPSDYSQSASRGMSAKTAAGMLKGQIEENSEGLVYEAFSEDNVYKFPEPVDYQKELIWTLDFNYDPQSSIICQEHETDTGFLVKVLDEIILWNSLPEHAAKEFCSRYDKYRDTQKLIRIYGDPSALWGTGRDLKPTFYKTIIDILRSPTEDGRPGFNVKLMMAPPQRGKLEKGETKEYVKIPVSGRVDCTNAMLRNALGEIRLRINPSCKYLICSLENVVWDDSGNFIDKKIDKYAKRKTKDIVRPMTHPTDALGYYIYKRFPMIKSKKGVMILQSPGDSTTIISNNKISSISYEDRALEELEQKKKLKEERRLKRKKEREQRVLEKENKKNSIKSIINRYRLFGY